jgi:hypothetical protein
MCAKSICTGVTVKTKGAVALTAPEIAQVKAFGALGYSHRRIGRELGKSPHTVAKALTGPGVVAEVKTLKADLADLYESLTRKTLEAVTEKDIQSASLLQKITSTGMMVDKMRLLRDESTSNMNVQVLFEVLELMRRRDQPYKYSNLPAPPETCQ